MAVFEIKPAAKELTVKLTLTVLPTDPPGKVSECRLSYEIEDKDGHIVAKGSGRGTEFGPVTPPPPPADLKGGILTTRFTCEGKHRTKVSFQVVVTGTTGAVPPVIKEIPESGLLSWSVDYDLR